MSFRDAVDAFVSEKVQAWANENQDTPILESGTIVLLACFAFLLAFLLACLLACLRVCLFIFDSRLAPWLLFRWGFFLGGGLSCFVFSWTVKVVNQSQHVRLESTAPPQAQYLGDIRFRLQDQPILAFKVV